MHTELSRNLLLYKTMPRYLCFLNIGSLRAQGLGNSYHHSNSSHFFPCFFIKYPIRHFYVSSTSQLMEFDEKLGASEEQRKQLVNVDW